MRQWIVRIIQAALIISMVVVVPPMAKQNVTVELFYAGAWHVHTQDLVGESEIVINHAQLDRQTGLAPSDATMVWKNGDGKMNPDNRKSPLFGLIGHNTPVRAAYPGDVRFAGRMVSWMPRRSEGKDKFVAWVESRASGTIQRLGQGEEQPKDSTLYRLYRPSNPTAFWALRDGQLAAAAALTSGSGGPFVEIQGESSLGVASVSPWIGSGLSLSRGEVTTIASAPAPMTAPTRIVLDTTFSWNSLGQNLIISIASDESGSSSIPFWDATVFGDGVLTYGNEVSGGASSSHNFKGVHHIRIDVVQSGADSVLTVYVDGVAQSTYTDTSYTLANYSHVVVRYDDAVDPAVDGPIILSSVALYVNTTPPPIADASAAAQGYPSESAGRRFLRICDEEDIAATVVGDPDDTQLMGPQPPETVLDVLGEVARTDAGIIHDTRVQEGLTLVTGRSLYN